MAVLFMSSADANGMDNARPTCTSNARTVSEPWAAAVVSTPAISSGNELATAPSAAMQVLSVVDCEHRARCRMRTVTSCTRGELNRSTVSRALSARSLVMASRPCCSSLTLYARLSTLIVNASSNLVAVGLAALEAVDDGPLAAWMPNMTVDPTLRARACSASDTFLVGRAPPFNCAMARPPVWALRFSRACCAMTSSWLSKMSSTGASGRAVSPIVGTLPSS